MEKQTISLERLKMYKEAAESRGLDYILVAIDRAISNTPSDTILEGKILVEPEVILAALEDKEICSDWKNKLKSDFPQLSEKNTYFNFGESYTIDTSSMLLKDNPFIIGDNWASGEDAKHCLFVDADSWKIESSKERVYGYNMIKLKFKRK
jgi:hypothetical protein